MTKIDGMHYEDIKPAKKSKVSINPLRTEIKTYEVAKADFWKTVRQAMRVRKQAKLTYKAAKLTAKALQLK
jgi:hypothetical protein